MLLLRVLPRRVRALAALTAIGLAGACATPPEPAPRPPPPPAAAPAPSIKPAASSPEGPPAPPATAAPAAPPDEPPCLPADLRARASVALADRAGDELAYCVQTGRNSDAEGRCFALNPDTSALRSRPWQRTFVFAVNLGDSELPSSTASATTASAAGTLSVCSGDRQCIRVRFRPPVKDPFDEVYGVIPAWAVPGTSRVIVADTKEGPWPKDGMPPGTLWLDVYDLKQGRKVAGSPIQKDFYGLRFYPIGERALLVACSRLDKTCGLFVVDPTRLSAKRLPIELHPALTTGAAAASLDILPVEGGGWAVLDARGQSLVVLSAAGDIARTIKLPNPSDIDVGTARAGTWSRGRIVVLESGPSAGTVHVIDPRDGSLKTHTPPACPAPPSQSTSG